MGVEPIVETGTQTLPGPRLDHEEWRFAAVLRDEGGVEHRLTAGFQVRRATRPGGGPLVAHGCEWATCEPGQPAYRAFTWCDDGGVELTRQEAADGWDPRIGEAVREACAGGRPILPARLLPGPARVADDRTGLDFGGVAELRAAGDDGCRVVLRGDGDEWELTARPLKPAVAASGAELVTRLAVEATWRRPEHPPVPLTGIALYRHGPAPARDGHARIAVHLDNGWDVVAADDGLLLVAPDGTRVGSPVTLVPGESWISTTTLHAYPVVWRIEAPGAGLSLRVTACFPEQERQAAFGLGALFDAAVTADGELGGEPVRGAGWLEIQPDHRITDFEGHVERLRDITHAEVVRLYPDEPDPDAIATLAGLSPAGSWPVEAVAGPLHRALVAPVRHLADAMGKGWRSYAALAAMEMQGVDSRHYRALAALVELMHTASLMVDDVEDNAPTRRGRPAVHTVFGQATAINTGTHTYLVFDQVARHLLPGDPDRRLRLYQAYLDGMRRNHAGQALDIAGHHDVMELAVATGDAAAVLERVRTTHRLKTGGMVRGVGEFGAILGGARGELLDAVSAYFEAVGLAYQITDDVADLRAVLVADGRPGARVAKLPGEDIREGKVTYPLAHAVARLPRDRLREVWEIVRAGGADPVAAAEVARAVDRCGATGASLADARTAVDQAWRPLQALLPVNHHTVMIRALGLYAASRHLDE
ncbi:polyprenyl synthetase family protein [Nonomuraea ceibae]|uniref:polyprenyl synthetase family protein n=1 Tax=Nonomuraea ceibae TaxID=1935170 RepID=UPI001C607584|nr:polyprenyl synthetase family protein [Nonomuraea ceibae]